MHPQEKPTAPTPPSNAARNRAYRKRLAEKGFAHFNVAVDRTTARRLRAIAKAHQCPLADVIAMGVLLSLRERGADTPTSAE